MGVGVLGLRRLSKSRGLGISGRKRCLGGYRSVVRGWRVPVRQSGDNWRGQGHGEIYKEHGEDEKQ